MNGDWLCNRLSGSLCRWLIITCLWPSIKSLWPSSKSCALCIKSLCKYIVDLFLIKSCWFKIIRCLNIPNSYNSFKYFRHTIWFHRWPIAGDKFFSHFLRIEVIGKSFHESEKASCLKDLLKLILSGTAFFKLHFLL